MLGVVHGNTTKYETGRITSMRFATASKMIRTLLEHRPAKLDLRVALKNLETLRAESRGWFQAHEGEQVATSAARKGAISHLSKMATDQERSVLSSLTKEKIVARANVPLDSNNSVTADVFVEGKVPMIIQRRKITSHNRNTHRRAIEDLAYQGFRVRKYKPKATTVAFVESQIPMTNGESFLLSEAYNKVVGNIESLLSLLLGT